MDATNQTSSTATKSSSAVVRKSYPISFSLRQDDLQHVLYIIDDPEGQKLDLEITNTSGRDIALVRTASPVSDSNHHFELRFRPGTLASVDRITLESANWSLHAASDTGPASLYFLCTEDRERSFKKGETLKLTLHRMSADGNGGARGTRVELRHRNLQYSGRSLEAVSPAPRIEHLSIINRRGQKHVPLHVGFVGSNTILNDGLTPNELRLRITNASKTHLSLNTAASQAPTKFIFSFDIQADKESKDWALGTGSQVQSIEFKNVYSFFQLADVKNAISLFDKLYAGELWDARLVLTLCPETRRLLPGYTRGQPPSKELLTTAVSELNAVLTNPSFVKTEAQNIRNVFAGIVPEVAGDPNKLPTQGDDLVRMNRLILENLFADEISNTRKWLIVAQREGQSSEWILSLLPTEQRTVWTPGEVMEFTCTNIVTGLPIGHANLYVRYENIPGYWDGQFVCVIEKGPIVLGTTKAGADKKQYEGRVGIGTTEPHSNLAVAGGATVGFGYTGTGAVDGVLLVQNKVGIGTTNPQSTLQVGNTDVDNVGELSVAGRGSFTENGTKRENWRRWSLITGQLTSAANILPNAADIHKLRIRDNNVGNSSVDRLVIDHDGNVGIGTKNPESKLQVGNTDVDNVGEICVAGRGSFIADSTTITHWRRWSLRTGEGTTEVDIHKLRIRDNNTGGSEADRLVIDQNGRVGIGSTNPNAVLEVAGSQPAAVSSGDGRNAEPVLQVIGGKGGNAGSGKGGIGGSVIIRGGEGGDSTTPANRGEGGSITLQPGRQGAGSPDWWYGPLLLSPEGGFVGIGTDNPQARLDVNGPIHANGPIRAGGIDVSGADVAENYFSQMDLGPGDVVCLDRENDGIVPSEKADDLLAIGVISTKSGVLLNAKSNGENHRAGMHAYPVALHGRVPCKVVDENGAIKRGDLLTTSSTTGHAMKALPVKVGELEIYRPGTIIGKALESHVSGKGSIEVLITGN